MVNKVTKLIETKKEKTKDWFGAHLIDDWKFGWKFWSIRFQVLGTFLLLLTALPDYALQAFALLPSDVKATLPKDLLYWLGIASIIGGAISRFFKQAKLDASRTGG